MNENHARLCPSPEWARYLQTEVLPVLTEGADLGDDLLEIGPGPGAATGWLSQRVRRLTAVEVDREAAGVLAARYRGGNVTVLVGDATSLRCPDESFDTVGTFTMLHHIPTRALQGSLLAEAFRVLRPGGVLVGSDSLASNDLHHFHVGDTYCPVDPAWLLSRLCDLGFGKVTVTVDGVLMFAARKPAAEQTADACSGAAD